MAGLSDDVAASAPDRRPFPIDISPYLSKTAKFRNPSSIKGFYKYFSIPGIGNLAGGLPNNNNFPFDTLEAATALPTRQSPSPNQLYDTLSAQLAATNLADGNASASNILVPKVSDQPNVLRRIDIKSALQYGTAQGYPPLYSFLRQFTRENMHPNVSYKDGPEIILTCGNTDGFAKSLEALSNTWSDGDPIELKEGLLVERFAYMNAIQAARPRGLNIVPVVMDEEGMSAEGPGGLLDVLENWDASKGKRPHLIYTVTIGQNPTSGTLSVHRRKAIYALCVKFDVLIIEDDPYWYLQYPSASSFSRAPRSIATAGAGSQRDPHDHSISEQAGASSPTTHTSAIPHRSSGYPFLDSLVPSYLSVDYQGRVIRLDTFSKTVAPGCRLGWITTQPALCERLLRITETSTQQPSGFVQSMIAELIMGPQHKDGKGGGKDNKGWQVEGWVRWLEGLRGNYERRMNTMCKILDNGRDLVKAGRRKCLGDLQDGVEGDEQWSVVEKVPVFDFTWPRGGMFIWLHINFPSHPLYKKFTDKHERLAKGLFIHLTKPKYRILMTPGSIFAPSEQIAKEEGWLYFRLCFAAVDDSLVADLSHKLVKGIHSFWGLKEVGDIEELMEADLGFEEAAGSLLSLAGIGC